MHTVDGGKISKAVFNLFFFQSYLIHIYLQGNFIAIFLDFHRRPPFAYYSIIINSNFFGRCFCVSQLFDGERKIMVPGILKEKHSLKLNTFI